ncbi:MAG: hypothetical protein RPR97_14530 [Colwellia sp.]
MESFPPYEGKPTAYLDQNILDLLAKYDTGELGVALVGDYQVVYSDETLKEIKRSKGFEAKFLNVLKDLNAYHLKIILEQPNFIVTDNVTLRNRDPFEAYDEYCQNHAEGVDVDRIMMPSLFKFSGGRKGDSIADIHKDQIAAFSEMISSIAELSDELPVEMQSHLADCSEAMTSHYKSILEETEKMMVKDIPDEKNWNGIKDFRNHIRIGPKQLNNVEPPNTLSKIWEQFKKVPPYSNNPIDIDDFFQLKKNPLDQDQPYYNHQKVTVIYNMLNTLGYHPDSDINKERRFIAAMSDNSHASYASFCHVLLSNDESFIKKVGAAYEYLAIPTLVKHIIINHG